VYVPYGQRDTTRLDTDAFYHGLGVASKAAGRYLGVNQNANLILSEMRSPDFTLTSQDKILAAYQEVFQDIQNVGRLGRALSVIVTGMFFGNSCYQFIFWFLGRES
jgi:hypothetical protein